MNGYHYTVTVTDWTKRRGYANSGRGWRVRCFGLPDNDWNARGETVYEKFFKTEKMARAKAEELARIYDARRPPE